LIFGGAVAVEVGVERCTEGPVEVLTYGACDSAVYCCVRARVSLGGQNSCASNVVEGGRVIVISLTAQVPWGLVYRWGSHASPGARSCWGSVRVRSARIPVGSIMPPGLEGEGATGFGLGTECWV
jgi:hypothetical protein